jgi:uncharacterized protein YcbK (DUF882 family)
VPIGKARLSISGFVASRAGYSCGLSVLLLLLLLGSKALQNAVAEGDTRTISMHHIHTDEDITITYKRDGRYDDAALEKLNWFLRDWRRGDATRMDPHLIDLVWEVQREMGTKEPIWVVCGYRSPQTNAMLRHRSKGVARFSQHMLGRAMDFYIPGAPLEELRVIGLRLQRGGVGFYPSSGSPFVHMDTGSIRMWPRMSREELVRVFPDGRTVHIPSDGRPLPGYAIALADIRKRGNSPSDNSMEAARNAGVEVGPILASNQDSGLNPLARFLRLAKDDEDEDADTTNNAASADNVASTATPPDPQPAPAQRPPKHLVVAAIEHAAVKAAEKTVAVARAGVAAAPKLIRVSRAEAATSAPAPAPDDATGRFVTLTPNQIIGARGYWGGLPGAVNADRSPPKSGNVLSTALAHRPTQVASADPETTGSTGSAGPWPEARDDHVPLQLALAYAEQPDRGAADSATAAAAAPATITAQRTIAAAPPVPQYGTTIAVKRAANQAASTVLTASAKLTSTAEAGAQFDNPWLIAMVWAPSVREFLTTATLGSQDFRELTPLMSKPASSVMMTFSADPNLGLTHDRFSGSAIVFVSTVTYPTQTAWLR